MSKYNNAAQPRVTISKLISSLKLLMSIKVKHITT